MSGVSAADGGAEFQGQGGEVGFGVVGRGAGCGGGGAGAEALEGGGWEEGGHGWVGLKGVVVVVDWW